MHSFTPPLGDNIHYGTCHPLEFDKAAFLDTFAPVRCENHLVLADEAPRLRSATATRVCRLTPNIAPQCSNARATISINSTTEI